MAREALVHIIRFAGQVLYRCPRVTSNVRLLITHFANETVMNDEYQLSMSTLCRSVSENGHMIRVEIYRGLDTDWTLEVIDAFNNSTVWDELFSTDQAALDEALRTIRKEGIESLVGAVEARE